MKFLLDTNVWIATLNNSPTVVAERVLQLLLEGVHRALPLHFT